MNLELFDEELQSPGEVLRSRLEEKGWTQDELALITGKSRKAINDVIRGRASITPEMAVCFGSAFGNSASDWMSLEIAYRISRVKTDQTDVLRKAKLFEFAPVRDMQRRGWIPDSSDIEELNRSLTEFFHCQPLDGAPMRFPIAFKKSSPVLPPNAAERAWCFRAWHMASAITVSDFDPSRMESLGRELRKLAAYPKEARRIAGLFSDYGIRFLIIEPLPGIKIDGAAFWMEEHSPVIAISGRLDRVDNLWFTIMHEFSHIKNGDALSVDIDLMKEDAGADVLIEGEAEARANAGAADSLVPLYEIDSFIRRVGPLYSKQKIIQFAHRIKIHPGIIVGQLQRRKEVGWSAHRDMLVKVRALVIETAMTDGWGKVINSGIL